jgi:hypothetical protein
MKVYQASAPLAPEGCQAGLPRENDTVMRSDAFPGASIINLRYLPPETRANDQEQKRERHAPLVPSQISEDSPHMWKTRHGSKSFSSHPTLKLTDRHELTNANRKLQGKSPSANGGSVQRSVELSRFAAGHC